MVQTDLHQMASRFIGVKEAPGAVHNAMILAMLRLDNIWPEGDEVPWCSAFVNFICFLLGLPRSRSLAARSWLTVGTEVHIGDARKGSDIVVFSRGNNPAQGHVAIFDRIDQNGVWVIGGNQHDTVSSAVFPISSVVGVRRLINP